MISLSAIYLTLFILVVVVVPAAALYWIVVYTVLKGRRK